MSKIGGEDAASLVLVVGTVVGPAMFRSALPCRGGITVSVSASCLLGVVSRRA